MFKLQRLGIAIIGNVSRSLAILLCLSFYSGASSAMPITFDHGGTGSGTLGGEAFAGDFTILAQADTDAITAFRTGFSLEHLFARIAIAGLGTFDLLTPTRTYVNHRLASVGFARSAGPDLLGGPSGAAAFASWNMRTSLALIEAQTTFDVAAILNLLKERRDVNRFERAKVIFNRAITQLRAREWKVGVTTVPLALDDHIDADGGLRLSFGLVVEGVDWDFITFQVYTSQYRRSLEQVNHDLVYQYALEARRQYGDKAGLDLGVTVFDGLTGSEGLTQEELKRDVEAALAAGIPEEQIFIFSFDGILQTVEARGLDLDDYFQPVDPLFYINVEPFTYVARAAGWAIDTLIDEGASNPSAIDQAEAITLAPHWIQNEDNGLCLTAENLAEGAGLTTQECTGLLTQQWRVDSDRQYIMSSDERFCLTHTGSHAEEGAAVRLSQCANLPEQRWAVLNYLGVMLNLEQRELALATNGNSVELRQGHTRQDNLWRYWQFIAAD